MTAFTKTDINPIGITDGIAVTKTTKQRPPIDTTGSPTTPPPDPINIQGTPGNPITYPLPPITPHGRYHITKGIHPEVVLKAFDGSVQFYVMGGRSIADRVRAPEVVQLKSITGLIPPWRHIDQRGATQDGVTHIDALYDPVEVQADFVCRGRDAKRTRKVVRTLYDSIDPIKESELGWLTLDMGYWWAPIRWYQGTQPTPLMGAQNTRQDVALRLRADDGFWRSYPVTKVLTGGGGFAPMVNVGDQKMYYDVVCYGPGTFTMSNGPSGGNVVFGPLLTNQIALVRTNPAKRGVYDLTVSAPPQQALGQFQQALHNFLTLASGGNMPPLLRAIESAFGIAPPQGPLYSLLKGRFSDAAAIPPKSPGASAKSYNVRVTISGGSGASKAIVSGTPLRRYPL